MPEKSATSSSRSSRPLGYDWQIGIGIVSSFAAREVIVSTLAIVYGVGEDAADNNRKSLYDTLRQAKRTDGSPVFTAATCLSLLVFYILAAQCLSTQAVVRRETNSWKWPLFQIAYMSGLAYVAALVVYQTMRHLGPRVTGWSRQRNFCFHKSVGPNLTP